MPKTQAQHKSSRSIIDKYVIISAQEDWICKRFLANEIYMEDFAFYYTVYPPILVPILSIGVARGGHEMPYCHSTILPSKDIKLLEPPLSE